MCVAATNNGGIDVAPESKERVDPILENYLLALAGVDQCSQNAPETVRSRLAVNLERAERAYADAAADGLRQPNGKLVIAGQSWRHGVPRFGLARILP